MPLKKVTQDISEVVTVNASVVGITTFADFELVLKIILLITLGGILNLGVPLVQIGCTYQFRA